MVPLPVLLRLPLAVALEQRLALALVLGQRVGLELPVEVGHTLALAEELPPARLALPQWEGEGVLLPLTLLLRDTLPVVQVL